MKLPLAPALALLGKLVPKNFISKLWRNRATILTWLIVTIGTVWMACGFLYRAPGAVMFGFALVGVVGLDAGYRLGAHVQAVRAARAPKPPPEPPPAAEEEKPKKAAVPPKAPPAKPAAPKPSKA